MLNPALFTLFGDVSGKTVLDAGSGEGYLSRLLAQKGAIVTGLEPAEGLVKHAIAREDHDQLGITYVQEDLSTWQEQSEEYDTVVSNMVFMDIPDYREAMRNSIRALKPEGLFVFSISHPCFDTKEKPREDLPYIQVSDYFSDYSIQNHIGKSYHHRLSDYVDLLIENGCRITKMLEPGLPDDVPHSERDKNVPNFLLIQAVKQ